ncbi:MAG TPA: phosphoenolpyruvate--protein phosphotransferase [Ktedonobacteraceae bacterium]|nr:phosphoenolpyruvate--protein phosphotransferase [Ktedonobacteraceae bacterium]
MTVGLVIVSHSAQLAAGVVELAGQMTQGKTPIAAAGGAIDDILGTSADKILEAIQSVDGPDGVLVLLDLGSAILSAELALEMLSDEQRNRVRLTYAPLVEGAFAAALEASLGHNLAQVQLMAEKTADVDQLLMLKPLTPTESETPENETPESISPGETSERTAQLTLANPTGLHARPAMLFVQTAAGYQANIRASGHGKDIDAASIFGVMSLGLRQGDTLTIRASGKDAEAAIQALSELVRVNFYEPATEIAIPPTVGADLSGTPPMYRPDTQLQGEPWHGITTSAGVAVGSALLYTSGVILLRAIEQQSISLDQVAAEQERLRGALASAAEELHSLALSLESSVGQAQAAIFDAQALMLRDPALLESTLYEIETKHIDAAGALAESGERSASTLETIDDPLIAGRAVDMRDAVSRAVEKLVDRLASKQDLSSLNHPVILIARDLTPSDTAQVRPEFVLGICTVQGGPTAHAAILARALGIPAIAGLNEAALQIIHSGDELGLDADNGLLYHQPTPEMHAQLVKRLAELQQQRATLKAAAQQEQAPIIFAGRHIQLLANVGSEAEAEAARQWNAQGIGLLRTEFLFAKATTLPDENEQRQLYIKVFRAFNGDTTSQPKPIVVRTLDAGADKPMVALDSVLGHMVEENPALGLRGIRIHLAHQSLLEQQLAAFLLAAGETGTQLHIMFPMITTVEELQVARTIFDRVYNRLKSQQVALPSHVLIGIMVEVPAAVVMASELAEYADFFSIGSNDLTQYTLACDRTNANVANIYNPMQPAVLRLIHQVAVAGRSAGKPVAVCGEMAGNVRLSPVLVGLGVDELSMTPTALPQVRAALAQWSSQELAELAKRVLDLKTIAEVEQVITELPEFHT